MAGSSKYNAKSRAKKRDTKAPKSGKASAPKRADLDFQKPPPGNEESWLLAYLPAAYPLPFGQVHRDIIAAFRYSLLTGGNMAAAAPRGTGKSTLVNGLLLMALLEGLTKFPATIPWDDKAKKRALRFWANELCFNARIHRDYPEATAPFKACRGVANRLAAVTQGGEATGARLGVDEGVIVLPNGLGAIGSATINGNPRGLNYASIDGRIIRPSIAVVDDPQDRKTAKSKKRVQDIIERLDADVAGMAGPDSRMPIVMPCTVIERDDVAEHYLTHPDWKAIRVGQIVTWPDGWETKGSRARRMWDEWNSIRVEECDCLSFYATNKAEMTQGMTVSWEWRFDAKRGQPDAFYGAMVDYYVMGEDAFAAERQNAPVKRGVTIYSLTPDIIISRAVDRPAGSAPDWSVLRIASTDINPSYGLTWGVLAFGRDQTAAVLAYGVHDMSVSAEATKPEYERAIYEALAIHGRKLAGLSCKPDAWFIDGGGTAFDVVNRFCMESVRLCGIQAFCATGRGSRNYRPFGKSILGTPREQCHMAIDLKKRKWIAWNADYWREIAQKAWTGSIGAPGSCSLPAGNHREFATQICREQLQGKDEVGGQMVWIWNTQPGRHDYGDVMGMGFMGAAWQGVGSGGTVSAKRYVERRKAKVVRE